MAKQDRLIAREGKTYWYWNAGTKLITRIHLTAAGPKVSHPTLARPKTLQAAKNTVANKTSNRSWGHPHKRHRATGWVHALTAILP